MKDVITIKFNNGEHSGFDYLCKNDIGDWVIGLHELTTDQIMRLYNDDMFIFNFDGSNYICDIHEICGNKDYTRFLELKVTPQLDDEVVLC